MSGHGEELVSPDGAEEDSDDDYPITIGVLSSRVQALELDKKTTLRTTREVWAEVTTGSRTYSSVS